MSARINLSAASPFGPIFGKELRSTARRKRSYFLRVGYLGFLLLFLIMVWSAVGAFRNSGGAAWRQQQQAELGQAFFATFTLFCVGAMGLIGPVLTATSVNSERLHRTLHVLLVTPINNWQIISGKLLSRMLIALTLIGLSLPVLALVRLLGGVELTQMFGVICLASVTALIGASIGLFFSTIIKRGYAVILLSYAAMAFIYIFVPFVVMFAISDNLGPRNGPYVAQIFSAFNPFGCAAMLMQNGSIQYAAWEWCVGVHVVLSAGLVACSALMLRRISRQENEGSPIVMTPLPISATTLPIPAPPIPLRAADGPPPPPATPPIGPTGATTDKPAIGTQGFPSTEAISDNPVLWRELRRPLMARRWQRVVGAISCVGLLLITYAMLASENDLGDNDTQIGYAFIFNAVLMLVACVLSATAIAQEKEGDTWTLLLTTPLSAREIILGKFWGALRKMLWPMALIIAHFALFTVARVISYRAFCVVIWVMVTFNLLWIATGILLSLCIRKVTFAVVLNLMLPVLIYAVVPIVLLIVGQLAREYDLPEFVLYYLPYYYMGMGIDELRTGTRDSHIYMPFNQKATSSDFLLYVFAAGSVYLALTGLVMWRTIAHFDRLVGRSRQK